MMEIEGQVRSALRDAVNLASRKPLHWGGLIGYQQMEAIGQACHRVANMDGTNIFWQRLTFQVDRAIERNRTLAEDLQKAHQKLKRVAECLHYPPSQYAKKGVNQPTAEQVAQDMDHILQEFQAETGKGLAQIALYCALKRRWKAYGKDLLHCYEIPGLPPDNLKLESRFGSLRRHQRRISGRKSTRELRDFGQYQTLFMAKSEEALLKQLQQVPYSDYLAHRRRLAEAEAPHQFLRRLHRDPAKTMQVLIDRYIACRTELAQTIPRQTECRFSI
jgi:hypothetical protein